MTIGWGEKKGFGETDLLKQELCEHRVTFLLGDDGRQVGRD